MACHVEEGRAACCAAEEANFGCNVVGFGRAAAGRHRI